MILQTIDDTVDETNISNNNLIVDFATKYNLDIKIENKFFLSIENAIAAAHAKSLKIVITIDEYDCLSRNKHLAKTDDGPPELTLMRGIFRSLKKSPGADFVFITGVMPLLIAELSGATNDVSILTHDYDFAGAVGLPRESVERGLGDIATWTYRNTTDTSVKQQKIATFVSEFSDFMQVCMLRSMLPFLFDLYIDFLFFQITEILQRLSFCICF